MTGAVVSESGAAESGTSLRADYSPLAPGYDRLVGILDASAGYHEQLRLSVRRMGLPARGAGLRLLDVGCGTGASTAALLQVLPEAEVVAVDTSAAMLERAKAKSWPRGVRFVHAGLDELAGGSEGLPRAARGPFDGALAAFLLLGLPPGEVDAALHALHGLLRPGGPLAVHDCSVADSLGARVRWLALSWGLVIPAGALVTGHTEVYRRLCRSVREFDRVADFERRLSAAGFTDPRSQSVPGWTRDIVYTFLGRKPVS